MMMKELYVHIYSSR